VLNMKFWYYFMFVSNWMHYVPYSFVIYL
jgi:hypothetical protein